MYVRCCVNILHCWQKWISYSKAFWSRRTKLKMINIYMQTVEFIFTYAVYVYKYILQHISEMLSSFPLYYNNTSDETGEHGSLSSLGSAIESATF